MAQDTMQEPKTETASVRTSKRPLPLKLLIGMQALLAGLSIPPGISLLEDPSGVALGGQSRVIPILNQYLPFVHDLFAVGIWLIAVYGVLPIAAALGIWSLKRWAWYVSVLIGAIVVAWIGLELVMFAPLGFTWFYPLIGGMGIAILALSLLSSVRRSLLVRRGYNTGLGLHRETANPSRID